MTWQQWVESETARLGLKRTSGYRSPAQERALGGSPRSYHTYGTPALPQAIDVGGTAGALTQLFEDIKQAFAGRINELYLNIPSGGSVGLRHNQPTSSNPEAGRPQHLHIAIEGPEGPAGNGAGGSAPASRIPAANRGDRAQDAAGAGGECVRSLSWTTPAGWVSAALGKEPPAGAVHSICWSDIWIYGAALSLLVGGSWLVFKGAGK